MKVTNELIDRVAALAKLRFNEQEKEEIREDLTRILDFCEKLNENNLQDVEPLVYLSDEACEMREDAARLDISKEEALKNAPQKDSDYFKVPKFLDRQ